MTAVYTVRSKTGRIVANCATEAEAKALVAQLKQRDSRRHTARSPSGSPIMLTHGLRVIGDGDEAYKVSDARHVLGHVVRFWIPGKGGGMRRQFRAFGENFDTLGDAVREFTKIRGVLLFDAKGDLPENSPRRRRLSPMRSPGQAMTYAEAKKLKETAEEESRAASTAERAFPRLANGLTPDAVRATPEYKAAAARNALAFARLRAVNEWFVKTFKKEYAADRAARRR